MIIHSYTCIPLSHASPSSTKTPFKGEFSSTTVTPSDVTSTFPADVIAVIVT